MVRIKIYCSRSINLKEIEKLLKENFKVDAEDAGFLPLPLSAYNKVRKQYNAILLAENLPSYSLWIVDKDIYVRGMNFVFGVALKNRAVVSTYRLPEEIIAKEAIHEIGHIFGLEHCNNKCVMQFSNSLPEAIRKPDYLCHKCREKVHRFQMS